MWCFCVLELVAQPLFVPPIPYVRNAGSEPSTGLNEMIYMRWGIPGIKSGGSPALSTQEGSWVLRTQA